MARPKRILVTGFPYHVYQRAHGKKNVFLDEEDFIMFLDTLKEAKKKIPVKIYAFCLMTNHFHLILQPTKTPSHLSFFMREFTSKFSKTYNQLYNRCGTLWSGRFKSSLIETDEYLLSCCRYIELNPVEAKIVRKPEEYPWSSFNHKIGNDFIPWLDSDPCYLRLGKNVSERERKYGNWIGRGISRDEKNFIQTAIKKEWITGSRPFKDRLASLPGAIQRKTF